MISAKWSGKERRSRLFLFGNYDFLLKVFIISGVQSANLCLWCTASNAHIQKDPNQWPQLPQQTLNNINADYRKFKCRGKDKRLPCAFNNVRHVPMFDMMPTQVSPPYLHIMLGIVKRHHTVLQDDCHSLDQEISMALATALHSNFKDNSPCRHYVNKQVHRKR